MSNTDVRKAFFFFFQGNASEKDVEVLNNVEVSNDFPEAIKEQVKKTLDEEEMEE